MTKGQKNTILTLSPPLKEIFDQKTIRKHLFESRILEIIKKEKNKNILLNIREEVVKQKEIDEKEKEKILSELNEVIGQEPNISPISKIKNKTPEPAEKVSFLEKSFDILKEIKFIPNSIYDLLPNSKKIDLNSLSNESKNLIKGQFGWDKKENIKPLKNLDGLLELIVNIGQNTTFKKIQLNGDWKSLMNLINELKKEENISTNKYYLSEINKLEKKLTTWSENENQFKPKIANEIFKQYSTKTNYRKSRTIGYSLASLAITGSLLFGGYKLKQNFFDSITSQEQVLSLSNSTNSKTEKKENIAPSKEDIEQDIIPIISKEKKEGIHPKKNIRQYEKSPISEKNRKILENLIEFYTPENSSEKNEIPITQEYINKLYQSLNKTPNNEYLIQKRELLISYLAENCSKLKLPFFLPNKNKPFLHYDISGNLFSEIQQKSPISSVERYLSSDTGSEGYKKFRNETKAIIDKIPLCH